MSSLGPMLMLHAANTMMMSQTIRNQYGHSRRRIAGSSIRPIVKQDALAYSTKANSSLDSDIIRQCVKAVQQDEEIQSVVNSYVNNVKDIRQTEETKVKDKFMIACSKFERVTSELEKAEALLASYGFELGFVQNANRFVKHADNEVGFSFDTRRTIKSFNYRELTLDQVLSGKNIYQDELDEFLKKYPDIKGKLAELEQERVELTKSKLALAFSKKKRDRLEDVESYIQQGNDLYDKQCELTQRAQFYASLTAEQKQVLANYFVNLNKFEELGQKTKLLKDHALYMSGRRIGEKEEEYEYLIQKRLEQAKNTLSEEDRAKIDEFCTSLAKKLAVASREELQEMRQIDRATVDKSDESMWVYKALCIQMRESYLSFKKEQEDSRTI